MEQQAPTPVVGVEGVRALAALLVLVSHVAIGTGWTFRNGSIGVAVARGDVGVSIFFVLSGFLLSMPMISRALSGGEQSPFGEYALRRAARIYPAYWVALFVVLLVGWWLVDVPEMTLFDATVPNIISAALLIHTYRPSTTIGPIGPAWSLATELSFYLSLPLLIRLCWVRSKRSPAQFRRALGVLLVSMMIIAPLFMTMYANFVPHRYWGMLATWLPTHLDEFAVGMAFAWLRVERQAGRLRLDAFDRMPSILGCGAVAALAYFVVSTQFDLEPNHIRYTGDQILPRHWSYLVVATAVLAPIALGSGSNRFIRGTFDNPVARFLGRISYGIYLWQLFILGEVMKARNEPAFAGDVVMNLLIVTAITIVISTASYYIIEHPAQRAAQQIIRRRSATSFPNVPDGEPAQQ